MKVSLEIICRREIENDGQTVHVYFEPIIGLYQAFGLSAYYATMAVDAVMSYSETLRMPVVLMSKRQLAELRQSMKMIDHPDGEYYCFQTRSYIGDEGYERWIEHRITK